MSSLVYGGIKYLRVRHAIYCKLCKDTIESKCYHDFKYCKCGAIAIDDARTLGSLDDMEDRSMYSANINGKLVWLPEDAYLNLNLVKLQNASEIQG